METQHNKANQQTSFGTNFMEVTCNAAIGCPTMDQSNWKFWSVVALTLGVLVAAICMASVTYNKNTKTSTPSLTASVQTFPGLIDATTKDDVPKVHLTGSYFYNGSSPFNVYLTCMSADLQMPENDPTGRSLFLTGGELSYAKLCNTFLPSDITPKPWALRSRNANASSAISVTTLGLAPVRGTDGKFTSPFLSELYRQGYTAWTFTNRKNLMACYAGIPAAPCLTWRWTPFAKPETGLYVVALIPTAKQPWKWAVIDVGRWLSILPGKASSTDMVLLTTSSKCSVQVTPGAYTVGLLPGRDDTWCLLGVSAVSFQSACTFDLKSNRFGLSVAEIGNIVENSRSYSFT